MGNLLCEPKQLNTLSICFPLSVYYRCKVTVKNSIPNASLSAWINWRCTKATKTVAASRTITTTVLLTECFQWCFSMATVLPSTVFLFVNSAKAFLFLRKPIVCPRNCRTFVELIKHSMSGLRFVSFSKDLLSPQWPLSWTNKACLRGVSYTSTKE